VGWEEDMRKFMLAAVAVVLIGGVAAAVMACDQDKAKGASASSCPASKNASTALAGSDGSCAAGKAAAAGSGCSAHKGDMAAAGACPAGSMACGKADGKCANYVITVADMDECCAGKIEKALSGVKNVQAVYVDAEAHKVWVCTGQEKFDSKAAVKSVQKAGFKQVKYAGVDSEHCVHEMKAAKDKPEVEAKKAS
jgi:hypothetical protein